MKGTRQAWRSLRLPVRKALSDPTWSRRWCRRGDRVRAMVLYNMFSSTGWPATLEPEISDQVDVVFGDVRDPAAVRELVEGASAVYHLAAIGRSPIRIPGSADLRGHQHHRDTPRARGRAGVRDTQVGAHLDERDVRHRRVGADQPSHPLQAQSPYAATKVAADKLVESYYLSFGIPAVTLRPFNTFGPRQSTRAVIPQVITQLASGRAGSPSEHSIPPVTSATSPTPRKRSWTWAPLRRRRSSERCSTLAWARTSPSVSLRRTSPDSWGSTPTSSRTPAAASKDSEVMQLVCDASKLRARTPWKPRVTRDEGLLRAIEWFTQPANLAATPPTSTTYERGTSRVRDHLPCGRARSGAASLMRLLIIGASGFLGAHVPTPGRVGRGRGDHGGAVPNYPALPGTSRSI